MGYISTAKTFIVGLAMINSASSQLVSSQTTTSQASQTSSALGATYTVTVAKQNARYVPETLTANIGDIIKFEFFQGNHSVIRSTWNQPCIPWDITYPNDVNGQIWSGWKPVTGVLPDDQMPSYQFKVNDTNPMFLYCGAPGSCNVQGMVMIINPNSTTPIDTYRKNSLAAPIILIPGQTLPDTELPGSSSTPSAAPAVNTDKHKSLSTGAIVGIAIGGFAFLVLVTSLLFCLKRRRSSHDPVRNSDYGMTPNVDSRYSTATNSYFPGPGGYQQQQQPVRETVIIPMTEAEKAQYLERLGAMSPGPTPMSPGLTHVSASNVRHDGEMMRPDNTAPVVQGVGANGTWHGPPVEI